MKSIEKFLSNVVLTGKGLNEIDKRKLSNCGLTERQVMDVFYQRCYELKSDCYIPLVSIIRTKEKEDYIPTLNISLYHVREVLGKDDFEVTNKYGFVIIEGNLCLTKINIREKGLSKPELFISKNKLKLMKSDRKGKTLDEVSSIEIDDIIIVNQ